jgi:hypothetical protein
MTLAYEDVTVANRFQHTDNSSVHPSLLPDGFPFKQMKPSLVVPDSITKATLCNSKYTNTNSQAPGSDPLLKLVAMVDTLKATDGVCTVSPGQTAPCPGGYCVPFLESQGSAMHTSCVSEEEMFPPIADTAITVRFPPP